MSYLEDFEAWKDAIEGIPLEKVKLPNQPIDDFVANTETLAVDAIGWRQFVIGAIYLYCFFKAKHGSQIRASLGTHPSGLFMFPPVV